MLSKAINKLIKKESLSEEEMILALDEIMEGRATDALVGSFLTALTIKGETIEEITGGAKVMRQKAEKINLDSLYTLDSCGTGGDMAGTFNISTATAFICAAAGIPVVKHGNRSVSSKCGSADVLEALGANIMLMPSEVENCVKSQGIGFLFAPSFHKAMKNVVKPRKELGFRTIFNILGPLTNPAKAKTQILGVYKETLTEPIARVLQNLGVEHALVVHGMDGLDEITITRETKVTELKNNNISTYTISPEDFNLSRGEAKDIVGGDAEENANIIKELFKGNKSKKRDILLLNSGAALYLGKKANSISEGIEMAKEIIDSGLAERKMNDYIEFTRRLA
ncbi:anthranilate phosphoribosyltransferase [Clostridium homopropionicum DSM 5847]|uniref:Anthranilate phosphoribosyltransferase n=1 Tax=Clostridium homopropionicum DSM 5847 TaxID=1121318 RepID=A0A0L6ZAI3_9CLOT|nr:anthranilate phosphoribosyltransferase [Clostridium homopropionicum]KOA19977.1 anthranilate phosphoribosyltransferase [Clostridium homopropionicum DSM 5847]SFG63777.1 anthranilate phosphoribosyltransferase [Clostridium homopropionicum]